MARSCETGGGRCTRCCDLVGVRELSLPSFRRCRFLRSPPDMQIGCAIYANPHRPLSCASFGCLWIILETLPEDLRPDKTGVVFIPVPELVQMNGKDIAVIEAYASKGHEEDFDQNILAISASINLGYAVLWRLPPLPDGLTERVRILVLNKETGSIEIGPVCDTIPRPPDWDVSREDRAFKAQALKDKQ